MLFVYIIDKLFIYVDTADHKCPPGPHNYPELRGESFWLIVIF